MTKNIIIPYFLYNSSKNSLELTDFLYIFLISLSSFFLVKSTFLFLNKIKILSDSKVSICELLFELLFSFIVNFKKYIILSFVESK